ncbi:MAG: GDP-mannose 4,6-dehydratase [Methylococcaceae bacterium]
MPIDVLSIPASKAGRALVLGVNGQDGSYLAERLLQSGWSVYGVGRQPTSRWLSPVPGFSYHALDLSNLSAFSALLHDIRPDAIFHFAAVHGSAGFSYEEHWKDVHSVNTISVHVILEYLRCGASGCTFIYASSSKVFGSTCSGQIAESSPRYSSCIYTITKNAATDLIVYYRKRHGIKASVVWTFNHESPRRDSTYFIPQIIDTLAKSILNRDYIGEIGTLSFWTDWGDAEEFMDIVVRIAEASPGTDLLLATGETLWAEDFVDTLFKKYGLCWKNHLTERLAPQSERSQKWQADLSALGTVTLLPVRTIFDVADDMLRLNHPKAWELTVARRNIQ